ncbi:MAG: multidrug effflux MFS transporter [Solirubrobacteraceae bacterium]|jgi:DHA1 family bicyclomycin/chloramphenicol resistance-like MFS transporter
MAPRLLAVLGALSAFGPLSTDMYLPGLPSMARDLGVSASTVQLTLSGCLIGLAIGQLITGPLSDALGRKRPLLAGLAAYASASVLCALSPGIGLLVTLRFVQGLAGAAGIAIARAIVRDRSGGVAAARAYAVLMVVTGLGPIVAPVAGGLLLHVTDWRGIFVTLAAIGVLLLVLTAAMIPETLAVSARHQGGLRTTRAAIAVLLRDRRYLGATGALALSFGALMSYIAASPFVLEHIHRLSAQAFSIVFAVNGGAILIARQIGAGQVQRVGPERVLRTGIAVQVAGTCGVLIVTLAGAGLAPLLVCLFIAAGSVGMIAPMATALGMQDHAAQAGSASGVMGFAQFALGSAVAPLVGVAGPGSALPMAITMPSMSIAGALALWLSRRPAGQPAPAAAG